MTSALTPDDADEDTALNIMNRGLLAAGFSIDGQPDVPNREAIQALNNVEHQLAKIKEQLATSTPPTDQFHRIGRYINVTPYNNVPLYDARATAGGSLPSQSDDESETLSSELPGGDVRGIKVFGDCMEPWFFDGDILLVKQNPSPAPGQAIIARILEDDTLTFKIYRVGSDGRSYLEPVKDSYGSVEPGKFEVVGVVLRLIRNVESGWF